MDDDEDEGREYTLDEVRDQLLKHIWFMIDYWEKEARAPTSKQKLEGLAHSILVALDGCSADLPAFDLLPAPCPEDKTYHQENGENWYPEAIKGQEDASIGGLHELYYVVGRKLGYVKERTDTRLSANLERYLNLEKSIDGKGHAEAEDIKNEMDKLWYAFSKEERDRLNDR
jgi:hypothetical protein